MAIQYFGLIRKENSSDYGVDFPDFPGCITAGKTLDEARAMAAEALNAHIELMLEDSEKLPVPTSLEKIMAIAENRDAVGILVDVNLPSSVRRINITIREEALSEIDQYAKNHGYTRSDFLTRAALKEIQKSAHCA